MSIKKTLCLILASLMLFISIQPVLAEYEATLTLASESITANNAPADSTLITAIFDNETLIAVKMYQGRDTITANFANDMADCLSQANTIKAFLWDMKTLTPVSNNINTLISLLPTIPPNTETTPTVEPTPTPTVEPTATPTVEPTSTPTPKSKVLTVYFSCTNSTEGIANHILNAIESDIYEIEAAVPYTEDDLKYYTDCRADREQSDTSARPEIAGSVSNMEDYDIIFLGYPIWHGQAPKIIYTFLESYDFSGKTIVPFCTSHSSGVGSSATNLHSICNGSNVIWKTGTRFAPSASSSSIVSWINGLNLDIEVK